LETIPEHSGYPDIIVPTSSLKHQSMYNDNHPTPKILLITDIHNWKGEYCNYGRILPLYNTG
jgi:hypothetical protein